MVAVAPPTAMVDQNVRYFLDDLVYIYQSASVRYVSGNHYGTPKPSKEPFVSLPQSVVLAGETNPVCPGAHPSSEGKRKRNRSNVEAMAAKNGADNSTNGPDSPGKL